jgi:hypothetical protein
MTANSIARSPARFIISCSIMPLFFASPGSAFAEPVHGPGSSHNPIVYHPVHGQGSSHNPIVVKPGRGGSRCGTQTSYPCGTVIHDHRNGKNCSYIAGNYSSYRQYLKCENG